MQSGQRFRIEIQNLKNQDFSFFQKTKIIFRTRIEIQNLKNQDFSFFKNKNYFQNPNWKRYNVMHISLHVRIAIIFYNDQYNST